MGWCSALAFIAERATCTVIPRPIGSDGRGSHFRLFEVAT